jgi:carbon monoxide dehydrogenase subunit G
MPLMSGNELQFGGEETFDLPPERLFAQLTDLDRVAKAIPDLVSSRLVDPKNLDCVIRPGFSFLRGTLRLHVAIVELKPPESALFRFVTRGIGAEISVESQLHLSPESTGTRLIWSAAVVELKGLVATLSRSLITAAAEKQIQATWQRVREQMRQKA